MIDFNFWLRAHCCCILVARKLFYLSLDNYAPDQVRAEAWKKWIFIRSLAEKLVRAHGINQYESDAIASVLEWMRSNNAWIGEADSLQKLLPDVTENPPIVVAGGVAGGA